VNGKPANAAGLALRVTFGGWLPGSIQLNQQQVKTAPAPRGDFKEHKYGCW
jgi:hypothetical protein